MSPPHPEDRRSPGEPGARSADDPLARAARLWPGELALIGPAGRRTWRELDRAAEGLAAALADAGAGPAGRVAVLLPRGEAAVALLHAVPRTGAAAAPLHAGWTERELADYAARITPSHLVCDASTRDDARAALPPGTSLVELGASWPPEVSRIQRPASETPRPAPRGSPSFHTILSTSGTSGRPKAVGLTLGNHLACARATERRMLLGPADRWLASLSPAHVGGVALIVRSAWTGAGLVLRERFDAAELAGLIERGEVTHASLVPTMLGRLLEVRGSRRAPLTLRGILLGGDAALPGMVKRALGLDYPVFPTYGLTEAASQVATARPEEALRVPGTVGRPLDGTEVQIGEDGEILVRGPTVMGGYVLGGPSRAPDGAERAERAEREPVLDTGGWLHTGDAGRLDEEGFLFVTGRLSNRIVSGGVTVDPARVEGALRSHAAVREAVVVGIADPEWGERVAAAVVPSDASERSGSAAERLERELEAHCRERLAGPALPRRWAFLDELPRNPNGKVDRDRLRALLSEAGAP